MSIFLEQTNVNLQDLSDKGKEFILKLTKTQEKDNKKRVSQLYDEILSWNSANPNVPLRVTYTAGTTNYLSSLELFETIFYERDYMKPLYERLDERKRELKAGFTIPDDPLSFYQQFGLKRPAVLTKYQGIYQEVDGDKRWKIVAEENYLKILGGGFLNTYIRLEYQNERFESATGYPICYFEEVDGEIIGGEFIFDEANKRISYEVVKVNDISDDSKIADDEWKCIEQFNKEKGFIPLSLSVNGSFKFQDISKKIDNRKVQIVFYKDHKLILRFADNSQPIPKMTGTWECGEDEKSYKLIWNNGQVQTRTLEGDKTESEDTKTENQDEPKKENLFSKACGTNVKACPTKQEVLDNKKAYRLCMKCPEIKELQESPRFSTFYSIRLRTMNLPEKTDEYFGPAMELAVKDFQASNRLGQTGKVGKYTYERITMPYKPVVFDDKKKPVDIKKVETGDEWLRPNSKL